MKTIYRDEIPNCDICNASNLEVVYDTIYHGSSWAFCCENCKPDNANAYLGTKIVKGNNPKNSEKTYSMAEEIEWAETLDPFELMADSVVETIDGCRVEAMVNALTAILPHYSC